MTHYNDPVYGDSCWYVERPLHRRVGSQHQDQWPGAATSHRQIHIRVTVLINAATVVPSALIITNDVDLVIAVVTGNAAVSGSLP